MFRKSVILVMGVLAAAAIAVSTAGCGLPDDAAASVNGVIITKDDVKHRIDIAAILYPQEVPADRESQEFLDYRGNVTKQLVSEEMEKQEAEKRGISVSTDEIEESLTIYVEDKYLGDVEKMEEVFANDGVSIDELRAEIERDLLHQKMLDSFHEETTISDEEVRAFYDQNQANYVHAERRQLRIITTATEAEAEAALARITAGEQFATVATEVSLDGATAQKGGLMGMVTADGLSADIGQVAFSMSYGEISQPFQTGSGWSIVKVEIIIPEANQSFEDLKEDLSFYMRNQKFSERWKEYSAELWETYDIEYADGYEPPEVVVTTPTAPVDPSAPAGTKY